MKKHPLYKTWIGLKERCYNSNRKDYKYYGARGIAVCDEWVKNVRQFIEDMGERPHGYQLERIENDLGYSKANCKWATRTEQLFNKRCTVRIEHKGKIVTLGELAILIGARRQTLYDKYRRGDNLSLIEKVNPRGGHSKRKKL